MEIRLARREDLAHIARLEQEIFSDPWSGHTLEDSLSLSHVRIFVATEENEIPAYAVVTSLAGEGELLRIACAPCRRRQGLAGLLMQAILSLWHTEGVTDAYLEVREGNLAAQKLYEAFGFRPVGIRRDYYEKPRENAVIFSWTSGEQRL